MSLLQPVTLKLNCLFFIRLDRDIVLRYMEEETRIHEPVISSTKVSHLFQGILDRSIDSGLSLLMFNDENELVGIRMTSIATMPEKIPSKNFEILSDYKHIIDKEPAKSRKDKRIGALCTVMYEAGVAHIPLKPNETDGLATRFCQELFKLAAGRGINFGEVLCTAKGSQRVCAKIKRFRLTAQFTTSKLILGPNSSRTGSCIMVESSNHQNKRVRVVDQWQPPNLNKKISIEVALPEDKQLTLDYLINDSRVNEPLLSCSQINEEDAKILLKDLNDRSVGSGLFLLMFDGDQLIGIRLTQRVCSKLGMDVVLEIPYKDYKDNGEMCFQNTPDGATSAKLFVADLKKMNFYPHHN
ncbi:N-acetyltransferase domain-containing protein [Aphelenchoides besseyi]|nr:N-acetyltransferase domain-containing protein [Aphelenchoides besseyi]